MKRGDLYDPETEAEREARRRFLVRFLLIVMVLAACIIGWAIAQVRMNSPAPNV